MRAQRENGEESRSSSEVRPEIAEDLHSLGLIAHGEGRNKDAVDFILRAIDVCPDEPIYYNNCGEAYRALREYALASKFYKRALSIDPNEAGTLYNLGLVLQSQGQLEDAVRQYENALAILPGFAEAHNNLGVAFQELGRLEEARVCYETALAENPYFPEAHNNLGAALKSLGRPLEGIVHHQTAMRLAPEEVRYHVAFVECVKELRLATAPDTLKNDLAAALSYKEVDPQDLAFVCSGLVTHSHSFRTLAATINSDSGDLPFEKLWAAGLNALHADPLFLALLQNAIVRDYSIELALTKIRRAVLNAASDFLSGQQSPTLASFIYALALQCFYNGYVYAVTEQEEAELRALKAFVQPDACRAVSNEPLLLAIVACYVGLNDADARLDISCVQGRNIDIGMREIIKQQVLQVQEEQRLRREIESVGTVEEGISRAVRNQYESYPYPRWLRLAVSERETLSSLIAKLFPHALVQNVDSIHPDVLVPGCGTGQQAIGRALQIPGARVLGIDLSLSSLAYGKRKAIELGSDNVEFKQADILSLERLNKSFDMIECIGVLHHLEDPVKGWKILARLLKPGGFMRIGLYSEFARKNVVAAQSEVARKGYAATPEGIRSARQDILRAAESSSISQVLQIKDFYTMAETRDLLFHVQERRFNLLEIAGLLREIGLKFVGFELANNEIQNRYSKRFPDDPAATSLENWNRYERENPDAFMSLYLFWVQY